MILLLRPLWPSSAAFCLARSTDRDLRSVSTADENLGLVDCSCRESLELDLAFDQPLHTAF